MCARVATGQRALRERLFEETDEAQIQRSWYQRWCVHTPMYIEPARKGRSQLTVA
jgi:hypothetical protein